MEVSRKPKSVDGVIGGGALIDQVVALTGLPDGELLQSELEQMIECVGHDRNELTIEGLRAAMIAYLDQLQPELLETTDH